MAGRAAEMDDHSLAGDNQEPARGAPHVISAGGLPGGVAELPEGPLMPWRT